MRKIIISKPKVLPWKLITAVMRLDRGAGNFYVMKVTEAKVAQINTVHDECLKAWNASLLNSMLTFISTNYSLVCPCWSGERGSIGRVHHLDRQGLEEGVVSSDVIIQVGFMTKHGVHEPRCKHH